MDRLNWDDYFFDIMHSVAKRATCNRGRSGCVITRNNRIISTGYVGAISKAGSCDDLGHVLEQRRRIYRGPKVEVDPGLDWDTATNSWVGKISEHCIRTIHAEMNAILYAAKAGVSLDGATLYCTMTPCRNCAMSIITVGIKTVKCEKVYHCAKESEKMFSDFGIILEYKTTEVMQYDKTV
jgi:dCMP deaminase